jgi:APA family basic amino acid/polyamine antiporter
MSDSVDVQDEGLVRAIGTGALGAGVVNMVVGGGIFVLPGLVAAELGSAALIAYLVCSVAVGLVFLCFAEIGSRITHSGGAYAYIEDAFGPFAGFVASTLLWFGWSVLSDAAITIALTDTIGIAFPRVTEPVPRALVIVALLTFLAGINVTGVRSGVRLYVLNTMAKLVPLTLLLVAGVFAVNFDNLVIRDWPSIGSIGAASVILFFAFAGAETSLSASGEIKNPTRTVPAGLLVGLTGILALYVGLQTVAQGMLGPELANNTEAPLAATAELVLGSWGSKMLLLGGVISIFGTVSGDVLSTPRVIFAAARNDNLPRFLAKVHPRYRTPHVSIIAFASLIGAFALSGTFRPLAAVASGSILTVYAGVCLAVLRVRARDGMPPDGQFRLPFGPVIPILACLVVGWLLLQLTRGEATRFLALVGLTAGFYGIRAIYRRGSSSVGPPVR